jgi:pyruvate dehydrogenase (quinone)
VQIDIDARLIGLRFPMEVNLVGDSAHTLRALIPRLARKTDRRWRGRIEDWVTQWWRLMDERAHLEADPVNPQLVFWELSGRLPDGCIVTADSGAGTNWYARDLKLRAGMRGSLSGTLATMGSGVPYAIAAKLAHPDRPVVAVVGDGAMQMNGMNELFTMAKYGDRFVDPTLVVLVVHNNDLNQVTWEMRAMVGDPKFSASQDVPDFDYAGFAEQLGLHGVRIERPEDVGRALDEAFAADRPTVVDAHVSPDVPPIPPHVEWKQMSAMMRSLLRGDPDAGSVVRHTVKHEAAGWLPWRG